MKLITVKNIVKQLINVSLCVRWFNHSLAPLRAVWMMSARCNSSCSYCRRWHEEDHDNELSTTEGEQLIDQLSELGILNLSLTGGELLLRKDFFQLVNYASRLGIPVITTTTNGFLIDAYIDDILNSKLSVLSVSLDTVNKGTYAKIRGVDNFDKVIANVKLLIKARAARKQDRPKITLNTVVSKNNYDELKDIIALCEELGVDSLNFSPVNNLPDNNYVNNTDEFTLKDKERLDDIFADILTDRRISLRSYDDFYKMIPSFLYDPESTRHVACYAGDLNIYIDRDGTIYPCDGRMVNFGNIRDVLLKDIWHSNDYRKVREEIRKEQHPLCWMSCYAPLRYTPLKTLWHKKLLKLF